MREDTPAAAKFIDITLRRTDSRHDSRIYHADHRKHLTEAQLEDPVGGTAVMHSYSTRPNMAQKYRTPMWKVPSCENLEGRDHYFGQ